MILKRPAELEIMADAAVINREALEAVEAAIRVGVTTAELNAIAEDAILSRGGKPAFKGYNGYPATLCTSLNEVVVHGFPTDRALVEGDLLSVDIGTFYRGFAADLARTYAIGEVSEEARRLVDAAERSLQAGIAQMQVGNRLGDVSAAIQGVIEADGFWVVREFVGHGIGRAFHEAPNVPNFGRAGTGPILRPGLVLAIEPMITVNETTVDVLEDGWTACSADGSLAAHVEHTVAVTDEGPWVLTAHGPSHAPRRGTSTTKTARRAGGRVETAGRDA
jgi:methionyl aminopeptidase